MMEGPLPFLTTTRLPPLYPEYRLRELALPQHNPDLPLPEGRHGKYIWISEHVRGSFKLLHNMDLILTERMAAAGWGNALQEHFVNGLLGYESGRS